MEPLLKAIHQDLEAARFAFNDNDFESMNVYANRIMSNVSFFSEAKVTGIQGFFLKDMALEYLRLSRRDAAALTTAKVFGEKYFGKLMQSISSTGDEMQIWKDFLELAS
jgi:hypothetical protein